MKKVIISALLLCILASCAQSTNSPETSSTPEPQETALATETPEQPSENPEIIPLISEIRQTYKEEFKADDGTVLWRAEYSRPVFAGSGIAAVINAVYDREQEDFIARQQDNYEMMNDGFVNDEFWLAGEELVDGVSVYIKNSICSVSAGGYFFSGGAHGISFYNIHNFDINSGAEIGPDEIIQPGSHIEIMKLYYEQNPSPFTDEWDTKSKNDVGGTLKLEDAEYILTEDGVEIVWNDMYTFYYAYGFPTVMVPYDRTDILTSAVTE